MSAYFVKLFRTIHKGSYYYHPSSGVIETSTSILLSFFLFPLDILIIFSLSIDSNFVLPYILSSTLFRGLPILLGKITRQKFRKMFSIFFDLDTKKIDQRKWFYILIFWIFYMIMIVNPVWLFVLKTIFL